MRLHTRFLRVDNGQGWQLVLRCSVAPARFRPELRPLAIVPGYAMNSFIFTFHPRGPSLEQSLCEAGYEVWCLDLRGQGYARRLADPRPYRLEDLALNDLDCALRAVLANTASRRKRVAAIGASLGGTLLYIHASMQTGHCLAAVVGVGAPLRWEALHPLLRWASAAPWLWGVLPLTNTRRWVGNLLPLLRRVPGLLGIYMRPETMDMSQVPRMLPTVEDPQPRLNRQLARWMAQQDLKLEGRSLTQAWGEVDLPFLCVVAEQDGIVPPEAARSAFAASGSSQKKMLSVGTPESPYAHANLFVGEQAQQKVFAPICRWLLASEAST